MRTSDVVILTVAIGLGFLAYLLRTVRARRLGRRLAAARKRDLEAASLLRQRGYRLVDVGASRRLRARYDGRERSVEVRADLLVRRGPRLYVVQVQAGKPSGRLPLRRTRRRLLEYFVAYRPNGILMVDVARQRVRVVEFALGPWWTSAGGQALRWVGAAVAGGVLTYALLSFTGS